MLVTFFGCGGIYQSGTIVKFAVFNLEDIFNILIPFFNKHPVFGVKYLNYLD
jgi:hypothetical protein